MKQLTRMTALVLSAILAIFLIIPSGMAASAPLYSADSLFTDRDLKQEADLSEAVRYTVADGQDIRITSAGVYVLSGEASGVTVVVEAGTEDRVQLVLQGLTVTNRNFPVIYVKSADKVFITTAADSTLSVTETFASDGDTHTDGVIFSRTDLTLNGTAVLNLSSAENGIAGKDDLKITGGTYLITASSKAIQANDSIRIKDGTFRISAGTDGLHAENSDDPVKGYIYIGGGNLTVSAGDDAVHALSAVQVDGGTLSLTGAEGIEATYIQLNGGTLSIQASDDGINAARKSSAYTPTVEINDGEITVAMGGGDTDGIDSNGNIIVNGGTVNVTGNSSFDYDGTAQFNGGTIIVNGQQVSSIPNQMMGGRGGNFGGGFGGNYGGGDRGGFGGGRRGNGGR